MSEEAQVAQRRAQPTIQPARATPYESTVNAGGLSTFTIADFLAMDITIQGSPIIAAGKQHLGRRIRWLHVAELVDTHGLLQGGELILTTGIALSHAPSEITRYVDALADQGVAALVLELGRRFTAVPPAMVSACESHEIPLIVLRREVAFVKMTEAAHSKILMGQRRLLHVTALAHERFTELNSADASVDELVAAAGELGEGQVVFSNLMHQVIALCANESGTKDLLSRWSRKAFTMTPVFGTHVDDADFSVVVPVEVRGQQRGRLILFASGPPDPAQVMVVERAAAAIAMRLLFEDDDVLIANAQRTALTDIVSGRYGSAEAMHARTAALGHPTRHRYFLPVVLISEHRDLEEIIKKALADSHVDALSGHLARNRWGVLLLLKSDQFGSAVDAFASRVSEWCQSAGVERPTLARGGLVADLVDVRRSFSKAIDVALASRASEPFIKWRNIYSIEDVELRGLLFTLRNDPRLQAFVERALGPLILRDARDGGDRINTLATYYRLQRNKSLTAKALGISRPTLYERLKRIERLLSLDLEDPESSTSLYAAIMVVETTTDGKHAESGREFLSWKDVDQAEDVPDETR